MNGHYIEQRPWGCFEILSGFPVQDESGQDVMVKKITVKPLSRLSYQSHKFRNEHWIVVQGKGRVILDGKEREVKAGESVDIPVGTKHRMINEGQDLDLIFIEVSTGHFDEGDNTRLEDDFGRK